MQRRKFIFISIATYLSTNLTGCWRSTPSKTVEDFYRSVEKGQIDRAIELISPSAVSNFGEGKIRQYLFQASSQMKIKGGIKSFQTNSETLNNDVAKVNYTIKYQNGDKETKDVELGKIGNDWKISASK
ncbi:MAG: DUF4878 domain-containing protein [Xenococcaceae cyanobacterium]